mgnify:CR=1 FL=1
MYNLNGENVNDNPNGFSGNEPTGNPNPDNNAQLNYGQPAPEQQTYNQPDNGPMTYDAPNANQQQAYNQNDYNPNSYNQNDYNQNAYNQSAYNQPNYGQQAFNNGNSYNAAPSYNINGDAPKKSCVFGVLGLILGIAALPFGWFVPIIGIILGIAAIILSILGMGKNRDLRGAAIAGLIISILATIFSIGVVVYAVITLSKTLSNAGKEIFDNSGITSDLDDFDFDSDSDDSDDYDDYDDYDDSYGDDKEVPLDNVVLYSANDVTITATSIVYSYYDDSVIPEIKVTVENNTSNDLGISVDYCAINGVTMYGYISGDIAAGKKSNEELSISTDDFTLTGFDSIDNIKLQVSFYDSDTYDTLIDDGVVQDINLSDSYTPFSISSVPGAVALDSSNGINAYYVGTTTGWDDTLVFVFYIENTTDKTCVAESDDFSINDFMQDDYGYGYILPGTGTFMSIEANDDITSIDDVTNASIKFEVRDYDSYETFYSSDELTFISNN